MCFFFYHDFSSSSHLFKEYQDLQNRITLAVEPFRMEGNQFVALANSFINKQNDSTGTFSLYQTIEGSAAQDIEYVTIADKHYFAVANHQEWRQYKVNSTIYQWNGQHFIKVQSIPTFGASSFNFFKIMQNFVLPLQISSMTLPIV